MTYGDYTQTLGIANQDSTPAEHKIAGPTNRLDHHFQSSQKTADPHTLQNHTWKKEPPGLGLGAGQLVALVKNNHKIEIDSYNNITTKPRSWTSFVGLGSPGKSLTAKKAFIETIKVIGSSNEKNKINLIKEFVHSPWPQAVLNNWSGEVFKGMVSPEILHLLTDTEKTELMTLLLDSSFATNVEKRVKTEVKVAILAEMSANSREPLLDVNNHGKRPIWRSPKMDHLAIIENGPPGGRSK